MDNPGIIISILRNIKTDEDIVRYCGTDRKIRRLCMEYSYQLFGRSYEEIIYSVLIRHAFPSLEKVISLKDLYNYYKSYKSIWTELNLIHGIDESLPMCGTNQERKYFADGGRIYPKDVRYIAPYHLAIVEGAKQITFVFFRHLNKLPTNIFTISLEEVITPFLFARYDTDSTEINLVSETFLTNNKNIWEEYINDPYWLKSEIIYEPQSFEEELKEVSRNPTCDRYLASGFERNDITRLIEKYFHLDHPVVEITFDT